MKKRFRKLAFVFQWGVICVILIFVTKLTADFLMNSHLRRFHKTYFSGKYLRQFSTFIGFRQQHGEYESSKLSPKCLSFESELSKVTKGPFGIPKIIHQVYMSSNLPPSYMKYLKKCRNLNKDFLHIIWTDNDFLLFLQMKRPEWLPLFKR